MPQSKAGSSRSKAKSTGAKAKKKAPISKSSVPAAPDDVRVSLAQLRDRLVSSLTLPTERVQEVTDDLVRRGRMTRQDAEDLLLRLTTAGRTQTEQLIADVEQLLGRSRVTRPASRALREVDKARRGLGVGTFPILGYDDLTAAEISSRLSDLTPAELRKVRDYERRNANRKSVLAAADKALK